MDPKVEQPTAPNNPVESTAGGVAVATPSEASNFTSAPSTNTEPSGIKATLGKFFGLSVSAPKSENTAPPTISPEQTAQYVADKNPVDPTPVPMPEADALPQATVLNETTDPALPGNPDFKPNLNPAPNPDPDSKPNLNPDPMPNPDIRPNLDPSINPAPNQEPATQALETQAIPSIEPTVIPTTVVEPTATQAEIPPIAMQPEPALQAASVNEAAPVIPTAPATPESPEPTVIATNEPASQTPGVSYNEVEWK